MSAAICGRARRKASRGWWARTRATRGFGCFVPAPAGWILIPTNNVQPGEEHITVAYGRDFGDVSPVAGILTGGGEHDVKVSVDVEEI